MRIPGSKAVPVVDGVGIQVGRKNGVGRGGSREEGEVWIMDVHLAEEAVIGERTFDHQQAGITIQRRDYE